MANQAEIVYQNGLAIVLALSAFRDSEEIRDAVIFDSDTYEGCWNPAVLPEGWDYSSQLRFKYGDWLSAINTNLQQYIGTSQIFYTLQTNAGAMFQSPHFILDNNVIRKRDSSVGTSGFIICFPINKQTNIKKINLTCKLVKYPQTGYTFIEFMLGKVVDSQIVVTFDSGQIRPFDAYEDFEWIPNDPIDVDYVMFRGFDNYMYFKYLKLGR